ncbi:hypothetical protein JTE90_010180 [Oedothorax gibbosus]|uniref:Uncharacterized protein n=1 Tax=Oedothorax gibbosus TaxID=931172 RepID=A0AAV6TFY5_9ARAC|nr:hypothetical protein JTE90_010180 [Oedothorax gibbosus]
MVDLNTIMFSIIPYKKDENGNEVYLKHPNTFDEVYNKTNDENNIFAKDRNNNTFYARRANGDEYYPTILGKEILCRDLDQVPRYAEKRNGDEIYPKDFHGNEYFGHGYALKSKVREYYPKDHTQSEIILPKIEGVAAQYAYLHDAQRYIYPKNNLGTEIVHGVYIKKGDEVFYPTYKNGMPYYPKDPSGNEYYVQGEHFLVSVAKLSNGSSIYAKKKTLDEYYPPDSFGKVVYAYNVDGTPKYALTKNHAVIFKKDAAGNQIYLPHDGFDYTYFDNNQPLPNYAKDAHGNEIYPRVKYVQGHSQEKILGGTYAKDAKGLTLYPLDDYNNEFTIHQNSLGDDKNYPLGYPLTHDRLYIIPRLNDKPYILKSATPQLSEHDIEYALVRVLNGKFSNDYLTKVKSQTRHARKNATNLNTNYQANLFPYVQSSSVGSTGGIANLGTSTVDKRTQQMYAVGVLVSVAFIMIIIMTRH